MTPEEKKLEKLNALFELVNADFATPDDLIKLSEALLGIITNEKERLDGVITEKEGKASRETANALTEVSKLETRFSNLVNKLQSDSSLTLSKATQALQKEIKRLEKKIPTRTDLSGLEAEIADIKLGLNTVPTEITANPEAVRDALELLQGDERLDKSAIRGFDDYDDIREKANLKGPGSPAGALKEMYGWRNGSVTTFNKMTVSASAPTDPKLLDLWFDIS